MPTTMIDKRKKTAYIAVKAHEGRTATSTIKTLKKILIGGDERTLRPVSVVDSAGRDDKANTRQYISDFQLYMKPEYRAMHKKRVLADVKRCGDIVDIEDVYSKDGKRILKRIYRHKNGARVVLCAFQAGVKSLKPMGGLFTVASI